MAATLTREEAHDAVDGAAQLGALAHLAAHWEVPGHWNEHAEWNADGLHEFVNESADLLGGDEQRSNGPADADDTGLAEWEGEV